MKLFHKLLLGTVGVALLVICSGASAAASCLLVIVGGDSSGSLACVYTGEDANYCYYNCACQGNCDKIYEELELEDA